MSHAGPPPPDEPPNEPYNPYPDDWESASASNPRFDVSAPTPDPSVPTPYGAPANPYAGPTAADRPTYGFGGYAGWLTRVGAYLIDYVLYAVTLAPLYAGEAILRANTTTTIDADGTKTSHYSGSIGLPLLLIVLGLVIALAFFVWNICIRQGRTGATVGKSVLAIRLVNSDLQPIGAGWSFLRFVLHILDYLPCCIGYLWPLWDSRKQTFADKIMNTFVIQATTPQPPPY